DRLALVEAAVGEVGGLEASRIEIDRGGESYSADTLETLRDARPDADLFLIVGGDVADELVTWERPDVIRDLATLVIVNRPGTPARGGAPAAAHPMDEPRRRLARAGGRRGVRRVCTPRLTGPHPTAERGCCESGRAHARGPGPGTRAGPARARRVRGNADARL